MDGKEGKKHVTTACTHCRRRKIKCNGETPCAHCQLSNQACIYNAADDKRRTPGRATNALRARLSQLERALQAHNIELPPQTPDDDGHRDQKRARRYSARNVSSSRSSGTSPVTTDDPTAPLGRIHEPEEPRTDSSTLPKDSISLSNISSTCPENEHIPAQPAAALARPAEAPTNTENFGTNRTFEDAMPLNVDSSPSPRLTNYAAFSQPEPADPDNITNSLSARMGSLQIAEDGQLRYYGPTSNLHLYHAGLHSLSRSTIRHVATEGTQVLARAGLEHPIAPDVERHLAELYFAWEDPSIHVVDEEIFFLERQKWKSGHTNTPYYSETLNSAMQVLCPRHPPRFVLIPASSCAIGASLATGEREAGQIPSPEFFSARAKALLDVEVDSPSVATVQALVIMSATEAAFTRDARGWLYSGMAVRLSADLGLHLDVIEEYRNGMLSQRDFDVRRTTFWGVFIHDNMWSMYVGRPWGISIRDISVSRPLNELDDIRRKIWKPYPLTNSKDRLANTGLLDPLESCTDVNITLCKFMRRINRTLYAGRKVGVDDLVRFLREMRQEFASWKDGLHPGLHIDPLKTDSLYLPHVMQLHMQFYAVLIFLLRPYFSRDLLRLTQAVPSQDDRMAVASVRSECISAAHNMADVLRCYQKQYSLKYTNVQVVHLIFTASLVHVYNACTCSPHGESQEALDDLQFCCQALGEIGGCYGNATRALDVVILVKREWQKLAAVRIAAGGGQKRVRLAAQGPGGQEEEGGGSRLAKRRGSSSVFDPSNPPRFTTPTNFETYRTTADNSASLGSFPREGGDMYDAWHFLNWAEIDPDLLAGVKSTTEALDGTVPGMLDGEDGAAFTVP